MALVIWSVRAKHDLLRLQDFLIRTYPPAAGSAYMRIRSAATSLGDFPYMGRLLPNQLAIREWVADFGKSGYVLRYRIKADGDVFIQRVFHSREDR